MSAPAALDIAEGLIREFEGLRLAPYRDVRGLWCVGFGNRWLITEAPVTADTPPLTDAGAMALLRFTLKERIVPRFCELVTVPLEDCQAGALLSFV